MFRFTIRDVLWLMVVVGLATAWFMQNRNSRAEYAAELNRLRDNASERYFESQSQLHRLVSKNNELKRRLEAKDNERLAIPETEN